MENKVTIKTGKSLSKTIDAIIKESIKSQLYKNAVDEKERQHDLLGEEDDDLFDDKSEKSEPSKSMEDEKEKLKKGEVTVDDVVGKLNTIRGGKSFKDEAISGKLDEYVNSLSKAEKTALFAFLKGLAQIVTGEFEPEAAIDPSDAPAKIKMQKGSAEQKKSIKPNVIKVPSKEKKEKSSSKEDTSGPVPIVPKKK